MTNSVNDYFRLLDLLIEQTKLGNVTWAKRSRPHSYVFRGSNAGVLLESVSEDGSFPLRLAILDADGKVKSRYITEAEGPLDEAFWDDRVKALWALIEPKSDPVASLIEDLEAMPPF